MNVAFTGQDYSGVQASNNIPLTLGVIVWNVNKVASFAPGNNVQITWTEDSSDFMVGPIIAVNQTALTITVNVTSYGGGPLNVPWSPWAFSLLSSTSGTGTGTTATTSTGGTTNNGGSSGAYTGGGSMLESSPFLGLVLSSLALILLWFWWPHMYLGK